jgi:lysozyme
MFTRTIIDTYRGDAVDIPLLANNGVSAILMKATQGLAYVDLTFAPRYVLAGANGLLRGSYHFATGDDPVKQVQHWFSIAMPGNSDALELDWEDNPQGSTATYDQVCRMVAEVQRLTGRYPLLYGSNFLREKIPAIGDSILFQCPLSLASYNRTPKLPRGWGKYTLWQYTGDDQNAAISPHTFPGASNALDIYQFDGTLEALRAQWPFAGGAP